jgi:hypothetical protein
LHKALDLLIECCRECKHTALACYFKQVHIDAIIIGQQDTAAGHTNCDQHSLKELQLQLLAVCRVLLQEAHKRAVHVCQANLRVAAAQLLLQCCVVLAGALEGWVLRLLTERWTRQHHNLQYGTARQQQQRAV